MINIKDIASKIFTAENQSLCRCKAGHDFCIQCCKCRADYADQMPDDFSNINKYIDHTILKANATYDEVINICLEADKYNFKSVCVNPFFIETIKKHLIKPELCTVVGFPLGANKTEVKLFETQLAIKDGATEIDMVINNTELRNRNITEVLEEITKIATLCTSNNVLLKVIIETCLLTAEEIIIACLISKKAGADFVKTSTGFSTKGAEIENVNLMRQTVGTKMGVKASGGIRTKADVLAMLKAGANRLGTSNSVGIINE